MSDLQALAEALTYLDGQGDAAPADPLDRAAVLIMQLADRGYVVRSPSGALLTDYSPASLLATRRQLGLRAEDVAREAGLSVETVRKAENPARRPQAASLKVIAGALMRLLAARAERSAAIDTMVSISQELDLP